MADLEAARHDHENALVLRTQDIIIEPPEDDEIVDPTCWFDTPGPFELEIGCGKGGFLLHRAMSNPSARLLGIEWANKYYRHCADRMARRGVANVRVMRTDAKFFVINHLPPACVSILHLYHPDPWPKKRHHKRRLVQLDFLEAAVRVLVPHGMWLIQSDHADYFEEIRRLLGDHPSFTEITWEDADVFGGPEWKGTNFEIKYAREGRQIHRVAYRRVGGDTA